MFRTVVLICELPAVVFGDEFRCLAGVVRHRYELFNDCVSNYMYVCLLFFLLPLAKASQKYHSATTRGLLAHPESTAGCETHPQRKRNTSSGKSLLL